jgi:Protein of unknown function (DUF4058)
MPIYSDENLYPGINAHLNSFLQNEAGGWRSFHSIYITYLFEAVEAVLPPGYFTLPEKSLQISQDAPSGSGKPSTTTPDITIYRGRVSSGKSTSATLTASSPVTTIPIMDLYTDEDYLTGLIIYQAGESSPIGRPITRVELLSPANKPSGAHYLNYIRKRHETLQSALRLVEVDYLHESRPISNALPSYADREPDAYPYTILVSDPRPSVEKGYTEVYGIGVDEKLPNVRIPLAGADEFVLDFGAVYNRTFATSRLFHTVADYEQEPVHFERYTEADRERIRDRLKIIIANYQ